MRLKPIIDLKVLYYFTVLAEELHFGSAAKRIGIEQPPLSLQMKKLEGILGAQLFDRSKRQTRLTETGKFLLPEAYKLLEQSRHVVDKMQNIARGELGILNIGFATSTLFSGITFALQAYNNRFPTVRLKLQELSSAAQIEALNNGTVDIGFIREVEEHPQIISRQISKEKFIGVVSDTHPLSKKKTITIQELTKEPFIHFPRTVAPALYDKIKLVFDQSKIYPVIVQEALEWQTIVSLVEANLGVSICPASFQKLKIGDVHYKTLSDLKAETSISVCYHSTNTSKLIPPFLDILNQHV